MMVGRVQVLAIPAPERIDYHQVKSRKITSLRWEEDLGANTTTAVLLGQIDSIE